VVVSQSYKRERERDVSRVQTREWNAHQSIASVMVFGQLVLLFLVLAGISVKWKESVMVIRW